jgi:hypothetical protein
LYKRTYSTSVSDPIAVDPVKPFRSGAMLKIIASACFVVATLGMTGGGMAATFCPDIVRPVCGFGKDSKPTNFVNACEAKKAGAHVLHAGQCASSGIFCPLIEMPVCAVNPMTHKPETFSNLCWAENAGAVLVHYGACKAH